MSLLCVCLFVSMGAEDWTRLTHGRVEPKPAGSDQPEIKEKLIFGRRNVPTRSTKGGASKDSHQNEPFTDCI